MKALFNAFQKGKGVKTVIQGVDMYSTFCLKTRDTLLGLALGFLLILLGGGCSPRVEHSIVPSQPQVGPFPPVAKSTVVILPMADYSQGERPDEAARRQAKVMASLGYELYKIGLVSAVQEDVNAYLMRRGIIRPIRESNKTEVVYYNANQWGELTNAVVDEVKNTAFALPRPDEVEAVGLGPEEIREISALFNAGYLLRGRIVEYEMREDFTLNPLRRGILPFFFDTTSSMVFGVARTDTYDLLQDAVVGGTLGAVLGANAGTPFNEPGKSTVTTGAHPRFAQTVTRESGGYSNHAGLNAATWGAVGAGAALLAKEGGAVPEAVVQIQLALQEPSGRVVWTNRAEVEVALRSAMGDNRKRILMDKAIDEATALLVADMGRQVFGISPSPPTPYPGDDQVVSQNSGSGAETDQESPGMPYPDVSGDYEAGSVEK